MQLNTLIAALGLFAPASALLRFGCSALTVQRLDPLVEPGMNPSTHLHQIIGGVCSSSPRFAVLCLSLICRRTLSTCRCLPRSMISQHSPLARVASSRRTCPTTGPPFSSIVPRMAHSRGSRSRPRSRETRAAW